MGSTKFQFWPDELLEIQIQGTIAKIEKEVNPDFKIGLEELLQRLLAERKRRAKRRGTDG